LIHDFLFYLVAGGMLILATCTVALRSLFHAALCLLGTLSGTAALFLLLGAELVALAQVMVYIGGVMVFVLYAVFLTTDLGGRMAPPRSWHAILAWIAAAAVFALVAGQIWVNAADPMLDPGVPVQTFASLRAIGSRLLDPGGNGFLVPFELVSVLLLAALVGALAVVKGLGTGKQEGA
jgi:NADH-quinone oxidoreductase subunit J